MVCASARCHPQSVNRRWCASRLGVAAQRQVGGQCGRGAFYTFKTQAVHGSAVLCICIEQRAWNAGTHKPAPTPPLPAPLLPPPSPTFNAQQGAAAALQIEQHLLTKGVVRLDLRQQVGRQAGGRAGTWIWMQGRRERGGEGRRQRAGTQQAHRAA